GAKRTCGLLRKSSSGRRFCAPRDSRCFTSPRWERIGSRTAAAEGLTIFAVPGTDRIPLNVLSRMARGTCARVGARAGIARLGAKERERAMAEEAARSRLGRGLAALIGDVGDETAVVERTRGHRRVPIEFLQPNPRNPRQAFS